MVSVNKVSIAWKRQEMIGATIIFLFAIISYLAEPFIISADQIREQYEQVYTMHHYSFNYYTAVMLPRLAAVSFLYGMFMIVNWMVRSMHKIYESKKPWLILLRIAVGFAVFAVTCVVVAIGVNMANDYAKPWLFNYGNFHPLALFGYMPNLMKAFWYAFNMMAVYAAYAYLREAITLFLQKRGNKNPLRLLVANQVTGILIAYLVIAMVMRNFDRLQHINLVNDYYSWITPVLLLSLANIYWIFPGMKAGEGFFHRRIILLLLITGLTCSLPFLLFPVNDHRPVFFLLFWIALIVIVTPVSWLYYSQRKDKILQLRAVQQALTRSQTDIQFLRSQINPHFLFNVLNTLYGTALQEGSTRTAEGIQKLGDMMRFMLHENNRDFIPMKREIEYLENYISLQQLRIRESPEININVNIDAAECIQQIAPMLLIPFVENAFKHGISFRNPSWIKINLQCHQSSIRFSVINSVHPQQKITEEDERTGIGIINVAERLNHTYPGKHTLSYKNEGDKFIVNLIIQF